MAGQRSEIKTPVGSGWTINQEIAEAICRLGVYMKQPPLLGGGWSGRILSTDGRNTARTRTHTKD